MTYLEWAQRFADLSFPWADPTYADRFQHLLQRIEARVNAGMRRIPPIHR